MARVRRGGHSPGLRLRPCHAFSARSRSPHLGVQLELGKLKAAAIRDVDLVQGKLVLEELKGKRGRERQGRAGQRAD